MHVTRDFVPFTSVTSLKGSSFFQQHLKPNEHRQARQAGGSRSVLDKQRVAKLALKIFENHLPVF